MLTKDEYFSALQELDTLLLQSVSDNTTEQNLIDLRINDLSSRICEYEEFHYPIPRPNLIDIIKFRIDQEGFWRWLKRIIWPYTNLD